MILDYENGIRREITRAFFTAQKQLNKYTLIYDEKKVHTFLILILTIYTVRLI